MVLSDASIIEKIKTKEITIEPFDIKKLQPASYDLSLGDEFLVFDKNKILIIDPKKEVNSSMKRIKKKNSYFILHPKEFVLAHTKEKIGVNDCYVARLEGKSSLGRLGLFIHITSGFLDPGNCLSMTLELFNATNFPIKLYSGMKIAQIAFEKLDKKCSRPYGHKNLGSKYFKDVSAQPSKMYKNFKNG